MVRSFFDQESAFKTKLCFCHYPISFPTDRLDNVFHIAFPCRIKALSFLFQISKKENQGLDATLARVGVVLRRQKPYGQDLGNITKFESMKDWGKELSFILNQRLKSGVFIDFQIVE